MTRAEAIERAHRVWKDGHLTVTPAIGSVPGLVEWWVDINGRGSHQLDSNGHVLCHEECKALESKLP